MNWFSVRGGAKKPPKNDEGWTTADRRAWAELSLARVIDALAQQREELNGIRTRAVTFTAFVISASAFLVGVGIEGAAVADRNGWFYPIAVLGTVLFALLAILLIAIVLPRQKFRLLFLPDILMGWQHGDDSYEDYDTALWGLVLHLIPEMLQENEDGLETIRERYRWLLICAFLTLASWVGLVWMFA